MKKTSAEILDYYDKEVIKLVMEKYGFSFFTALRNFLFSETYSMLADSELEMWDFAPLAIFDIWETEQITGEPRNSQYLRSE
jgi:hypothetical protein